MSNLRELNIQGHTIAAYEFNRGKLQISVICLHGITSSVEYWKWAQTPLINDEFHWISLSLPGHYPAEFPT